MSIEDSTNVAYQIVQHAHTLANRRAPFSDKLKDVEAELRTRRKQFLGSHISLRALVLFGTNLEDNTVNELSDYLASRTVFHWQNKTDDAERFCFHFYRLMLYALAGGKVRGECVDDILRLAEILNANQTVFTIAMKTMLPDDLIGELFNFMDTSDKALITSPTFPDAVLGGVCIFLGVLPDPFLIAKEEG